MKQKAYNNDAISVYATGPEQGFDEALYLRLNPDVLAAVAAGKFGSGREHYENYGRAEGRVVALPADLSTDRVVITARPGQSVEALQPPMGVVDRAVLSPTGGLFIAGWVNDALDQLEAVELYVAGWSIIFSASGLGRDMRPDTYEIAGIKTPYSTGFHGFIYTGQRLSVGPCTVVFRMKSGAEQPLITNIVAMDDNELRDTVLRYIGSIAYKGHEYFGAMAALRTVMGQQIVDFNRMLVRRAGNAPYVKRFHKTGLSPKVSFIVCLEGQPQYLSVQQALFSRQSGVEACEFIYICDQPELFEVLQAEANLAALFYGLDMMLVLTCANIGRAGALNVAAKYARSRRLVFLDKHVAAKQPGFVKSHLKMIEAAPNAKNRLMGGALYATNGSLLQAGAFVEQDTAPGFAVGSRENVNILRVAYYGKTAVPEDKTVLQPREVPGLSAAFLSINRDLFEGLDGFVEDYVFNHDPGVDLCLRAAGRGYPAWLSGLQLYHAAPGVPPQDSHSRGCDLINCWLFTRNWQDEAGREMPA